MSVQAPPYELLGRPISGPRAITGDWRRFWHLTFNIAVMQWKLRFYGSALGYLWQLVRPLLLFLVLYVFFTKVAHVGSGKGPSYHYYGAQLLSAIVLFTFFGEATMNAVRGVVDNEVLVRKIQFPRMVIPLSIVLLAVFNLCLNLIVVTIFALAAGVRPMLTWLEVVPILALLVILCAGIAMLLSALFVYFRDIQPIWEVVNQVIFYASPIIIPIVTVQKHLSTALLHLYMLNPLSVIFQQFKHAFITHATPSAGALLGSQAALLAPIGIVLAIFVIGFVVFNRIAPRVAEDL
ncbi:MAG: ABC transporter permease [Solirubrobacteraceae bacterium]|jgi:ABC-2 type transport system permease protein